MNCPQCGTKLVCVDSRDTLTKTFGMLRRRRLECAEHGRFTSAEMLLSGADRNVETALRDMVGDEFKAAIRTAANHILNLAGGK